MQNLLTWAIAAVMAGEVPAGTPEAPCEPTHEANVDLTNSEYMGALTAAKGGQPAEAERLYRAAARHSVCAADSRPEAALELLTDAFNVHQQMLELRQADASEAALREALDVCDRLLARLDATPGADHDEQRREVDEQRTKLKARLPPPKTEPSRRRPLVPAGSTLLALGAGSLAAMAAGLALGARTKQQLKAADEDMRDPFFQAGPRYNTLAYVSGALAGVFVIGGVALLAAGLRRKPQQRVRVSPTLGLHTATLQLSAHF